MPHGTLAARREYAREWRERNRERVRKHNTAWAAANREIARASNAKYRAKHSDRIAVYEEKRKPAKLAGMRAARLSDPAREAFKKIKERAGQTSRPFDLTLDYIRSLIERTSTCPILDVPLVYGSLGKPAPDSASFDCFYPKLGYVVGNVFIISYRANMLKSNATLAEVQALASWMEAITVVTEEQSE